VALSDITRESVLQAMNEYDERGADEFLSSYGYGGARSYRVAEHGRQYDSKAIAGVAHGYATGYYSRHNTPHHRRQYIWHPADPDEQWAIVLRWRDAGYTFAAFLDTLHAHYDYNEEFRLPNGNIWPGSEYDRQKRQELRESLDAGMLPDQAVAAAGLGPEKLKAKYEELEAKNKRQNDSILRQAATITRMQSQSDDITKMPDETRAQLLNQAKSLLRRPVQVTKPPVAG
jgi:hypothetical protein